MTNPVLQRYLKVQSGKSACVRITQVSQITGFIEYISKQLNKQ